MTINSWYLIDFRKLAYRFLTLQHHQIIKIANKLGLLQKNHRSLEDFELYEGICEKAKTKNKLNELWDAVESAHQKK